MNANLFSGQKPLHLLFFPVLFVVNHFFVIVTPVNPPLIHNVWIWILNTVGALVFCTAFPFLLYILLSAKLTKIKAAALSTVVFLPIFFFQDLLLSSGELMITFRARFVVPVLFGILIALCYWIIKAQKSFQTFTQYLNIVSFSMVMYTMIVLVLSFERLSPKILKYSAPVHIYDSKTRPDIYFFLLDSYTSNKSLRDHFLFENKEFTEKLNDLDFTVSDQAISSYARTSYSLNATLNFDQIENMDQYTYGLGETIQFGSVIKSLEGLDYEIRNYSFFDIDDQPSYYTVSPATPVGFVNGILQSSIFNIVYYDFVMKLRLYGIHSRILNEIREEGLKHHTSPRFFYGHILAPHPPFVIDAAGQPIGFLNQPRNMANTAAYVAQIKGLNKLVSSTVTSILEASPESIVIIMGDHGYRYLSTPAKDEESYTVFLAYHGPDRQSLGTLTTSHRIFNLVFKGLEKEK